MIWNKAMSSRSMTLPRRGRRNRRRPILPERPTSSLPSLELKDTVYVAGPPSLDAVRQKARAAAARCYGDPFLPSAQAPQVERAMVMLRAPPCRRPRRLYPDLPRGAKRRYGTARLLLRTG
jgi:hypothetical protein